MQFNRRSLEAGAAQLAGVMLTTAAVQAQRSVRSARRSTVVHGEERTVAVGRRGVAVAGEHGEAAVGRHGAVAVGARVVSGGSIAYQVVPAPAGAIVATLPARCTSVRVGGVAYTQCGPTYYHHVATGYQVVVLRGQ
jgi:Family of unknown function (DUF6515)